MTVTRTGVVCGHSCGVLCSGIGLAILRNDGRMTCAADAIESFANTAMVLTNTGHVTSGFRDGVHANVIERVQIANSGRMDGFEFAINTLGTGACDVAEKLDLTAFGYASLAVLAADATNSGLGLVFDFSHGGGGSLTDAGLTLAMLSAVDVTL